MARFFIEVTQVAFDRLAEQAVAQRRDVRDQAAVLLERALGVRPHEGETTATVGADDGGCDEPC